jgi:hypothetical protein
MTTASLSEEQVDNLQQQAQGEFIRIVDTKRRIIVYSPISFGGLGLHQL